MKLSELKPCAICGGPLKSPMAGNWYVLRTSMAMIKPRAASQVMGLASMFGGNLGIAEVMAPDDNAVAILGDEDKELMEEKHVCSDCWFEKIAIHFPK